MIKIYKISIGPNKCVKQCLKSIKIFLITNINGQAVPHFLCRSQEGSSIYVPPFCASV